MNIEQRRLQQANARIESVNELADLVSDIEASQSANRLQMENHIEIHKHEIEAAFVHLGLTDSQEFLIDNIVNKLTENISLLFEQDAQLGLRLNKVLEKQKSLLQLH
jgi:hypothetical protein